MSEETEYNPLQFSVMIGDRQFVFRGRTGEELLEAAKSMAENNEEFLKTVNELQQTHIANGIFSKNQQQESKSTFKKPSQKKADTPPPVSDGEEAPQCLHGPMADMAGKGYKKRWYCPEFGKSKECWAKD